MRCITFLAGLDYRRYLIPSLVDRGIQCRIPMEGLAIGKQLSWLDKHTKSPSGFF
jgi:hypothetical protein